MQLREFAGGDKDLFSAERKMRKQQRKVEQQSERQYQRDKEDSKSNVFNFINKTLGDKRKSKKTHDVLMMFKIIRNCIHMICYLVAKDDAGNSSRGKLKTESNRNLNVASFQVGEDISRLEKESSKLKESMARHTKGSTLYNNIVIKYNETQKELTNLRASEKNIVAEQNQRKNKAKLTVF